MSVATPADVAARWPPGLPPPDAETVQTWLDDAEIILTGAYPDLAERAETDPAVHAGVVLVEARMVIRALSNPRGVVREQVGDTSVSYRSDALGSLELAPGDQELLDGLLGLPAPGGLVSLPVSVAVPGGDWPADWWQRNLEDPP